MKTTTPPITWEDAKKHLDALTPVTGGFSLARRGLLHLPDGRQVFVKIGTEDNSRQWAKKEVAVYRYLQENAYPAAPQLLCASPEETSFVLEALPGSEGWDWSDTWTPERLAATLSALDALASLHPVKEAWLSMGKQALDQSRNGWAILHESPNLQKTLLVKLRAAGYADLAASLDFTKEFERSVHFTFRTDTLVHYDVRADNCAWNPSTNQVKLVDWNWAQYGDPRIDQAAMLTHAHKSGLDISRSHAARLDSNALQWMAGFWFKAAATPIWPGGPDHLRDFQLQSGLTALQLAGL